jgi:hypothetical protein|tara:strand:- start:2209 stop:2322 length:114 start_codon:yes stop_codon:yes gene_type:complete
MDEYNQLFRTMPLDLAVSFMADGWIIQEQEEGEDYNG